MSFTFHQYNSIHFPGTVDYICITLLLPTEQPPFLRFCNSRCWDGFIRCCGLNPVPHECQVLYQLTYIISPRNRKSPDLTKGNLFFPTKPLLKTVIKCTFRSSNQFLLYLFNTKLTSTLIGLSSFFKK